MNKCLDAFKNVYVEVHGDRLNVSTCCLVSPKIVVNQENFLNNPNLIKIREEFNQGLRPTECHQCWSKEDNGFPSRRTDGNPWYIQNGYDDDTAELISIDYWVGNVCNLKCVICGPEYSSAWQQELDPTRKYSPHYDNKFWKQLDLTKLRLVHFNGGEPLLSKTHVDFLNAIPNKDQVIIDYNTNGTIFPSEELFSLWKQFKLVHVYFSIDDIEDRFEYIRYPANWEKTVKNILEIKEAASQNVLFYINTTISLLNIFTYPTLLQWLEKNFKENKYGHQVAYLWQWASGNLNCQTIPVKYKDTLVTIYKDTGYQNIVNSINFTEYCTLDKQLNFLNTLDQRRANDYRKVFQHLS
jgi:sulfatase maturation enzyme AslB (radical SAM superfamily)